VVVEPFPWLEIGTPNQLIDAAMILAPENEGRQPSSYIHPEAKAEAKVLRCVLGPGVHLEPGMDDSDAFWYLDGMKQKRVNLQGG
jgi:hypothetical protein